MGRPQVSFAKRQREQAKREKRQLKAEKKALRQSEATTEPDIDGIDPDLLEQPIADDVDYGAEEK